MAKLRDFTEEELWELIEKEMRVGRRWTIIERLHMRICALRSTRERLDLMKKFSGQPA
jgi:hypothetical protein